MTFNLAKRVAKLCLLTSLLVWAPAMAQPTPELEQGMRAFYAKDFETAKELFETALKSNPQDSLAMSYILDIAYKTKKMDETINRIEQKAVARGEDPTSMAHLGMAYFLRGMVRPDYMDEAITELKQAAEDDPQLSIARTGLGMVYYQKRMMPRAKGFFHKARRLNQHDIIATEMYGNILLVDEKNPEEARQLFEQIVEKLPTYPDGHYYMGSSLFDLGRLDEAIPYLAQCRELDPNGLTKGFDAAALLGDVLMKENRTQEAIEAYEKAREMRPKSQYIETRIKQAKGEQV